MPRHGHSELHTLGIHPGKDLLQRLRSSCRLGLATFQAVLEGEQRLPNRVGERDLGVVQEGDGAHPPAEESARHGAAERACQHHT